MIFLLLGLIPQLTNIFYGPDPQAIGFNPYFQVWLCTVYAFPPYYDGGPIFISLYCKSIIRWNINFPIWPTQPYFPALLDVLSQKTFFFFQLCYQKGQPSFPDMQGNFWHVLFLQGQKLWKIFWNRRSHALNTDTSNTLLIGSLFRKLCISKVDINYIGMFLIFMFEEVLSVLLLIICAMLSLFLLEIN